MFSKTVSSRDAAPEPAGMHSRRVLVNMCVSCTASDRLFGTSFWCRWCAVSGSHGARYGLISAPLVKSSHESDHNHDWRLSKA